MTSSRPSTFVYRLGFQFHPSSLTPLATPQSGAAPLGLPTVVFRTRTLGLGSSLTALPLPQHLPMPSSLRDCPCSSGTGYAVPPGTRRSQSGAAPSVSFLAECFSAPHPRGLVRGSESGNLPRIFPDAWFRFPLSNFRLPTTDN